MHKNLFAVCPTQAPVALAAALCVASASMWSPSLAFAQATVTAGEDAATQSGIQQVTITSTKRQTLLQQTPDSVSVLRGEDLAQKGQTGLEDLKLSVPNVNFAATSNTSQLYIRGIGNTFINAGGDPGVALYQDGAYVSDQTTSNASFFDVQRIEVLRGPQGGLYGRNAVGGAVNIISAAPSSRFGARASLTLGDYGRRELDGYVTGPFGASDTSFRASLQVKRHDGYIKNTLAGQAGAPSRLDDLDSQALRLQTSTRLPGDGTLRLMLSAYNESDVGAALSVVPQPGVVYPVEQLYGAVPSSDPRLVHANLGGHKSRVTALNSSYDVDLGGHSLSLLANYRKSKQDFANDCDGTVINNCRYLRPSKSDDFFLDGHLSSPDTAKLRWLIGVSHLQFKMDQRNDVVFPFPMTYLDPTADPTLPFGFHVASGGSLKVKSSAVYADIGWRLDAKWTLSGQLRHTQTRKDAKETLIIEDFAVNAVDVPKGLKESSSPVRVGLEGQLSKDMLVFGHFATASKDGAINLGALQTDPVRPEKVKSVEIGLKASAFERRVQVNTALFASGYRDRQISQIIGTVAALVNVPKSQVKGAEIEVSALPTRDLRLGLGLGYLDARLQEFKNGRIIPGLAGGPVVDLAGKQLSYVPRVSVTASADWDMHLGGSTATLGANYVHRSRIYFDEFNDLSNSQAAVGTLNLSAKFKPASGAWTAHAYLNNVTDEKIQTGATIYSGLIGAARATSYAPPRTFGLGMTWAFQ
jgi:iron complex outermembrane recepter protein